MNLAELLQTTRVPQAQAQQSGGLEDIMRFLSANSNLYQLPQMQMPDNAPQLPERRTGGIVDDEQEFKYKYGPLMQSIQEAEPNPIRKVQLKALSDIASSSNPILRKFALGAVGDIVQGSQANLNRTDLQKNMEDPITAAMKRKEVARMGVPTGMEVDPETGQLRPMVLDNGQSYQDFVVQNQIKVKQTPGYGAEDQLQLAKDAGRRADMHTEKNMKQQDRQLGLDQIRTANTLRDDFDQKSKEYWNVRNAYTNIKSNLDKPEDKQTAPAQVSAIYQYIKLLDPNTGVKEGEYATASNTTGIPGQILNAYNHARSGLILNPTQIKEFKDVADTLYSTQATPQVNRIKNYARMAKEAGINPKNIIGEFDPRELKKSFKSAQEYNDFLADIRPSDSRPASKSVMSPAEAKAAGMTREQYIQHVRGAK